MKILVVEDTKFMADTAVELLTNMGHEVTCVAGFSDAETPVFNDSDDNDVELVLEDFELVFLDGDLLHHEEGKDVVPAIVKAGVPVVGTSTLPNMNEAMVEAGATGSVPKGTWLLAMVHNRVTPEQFAEFSDATIEALAQVDADSKSSAEFRKAGDEILRKHM